ncbi:MAG: tRNA (cytidine(34)-2'-O)-methyltransferase [Anaerolineaceae bacterium]|nr:tRNA (cytidine(34)-2'-O)-methyltransferase [Anaerolineaceae bacterium]MCB9101647.1 tRNA (cytidine(34)-2'-O)-methyltransferase [Anaerolineales bacterium]
MFNVVLIEPQIPQNTGNIARLCAATDMDLIIVGEPGFSLSSRYLRRAGLDYWEFARIKHLPDVEAYFAQLDFARTHLLTTKVKRPYTQIQPQPGDSFLFGKETAGLPEWLLKANPNSCATIPMKNPKVRSLNLATSVGIVMYQMLSVYGFGLD